MSTLHEYVPTAIYFPYKISLKCRLKIHLEPL